MASPTGQWLKPFLALLVVLLFVAGCRASEGPTRATPRGTLLPPVDGTVAPGSAGSSGPFTVSPNPDPPGAIAVLTDVRIGGHPEAGGWDRIVFEFEDALPKGTVAYEPKAMNCGSGAPVTLQGSASLVVRFTPAQAHDQIGGLTIRSKELIGPGNVILEAKLTCDFEAEVTWAIGVARFSNFRVTVLDHPARVVIDVKW